MIIRLTPSEINNSDLIILGMVLDNNVSLLKEN
jgi:hypothetical protein